MFLMVHVPALLSGFSSASFSIGFQLTIHSFFHWSFSSVVTSVGRVKPGTGTVNQCHSPDV